MNFSKSEVLEIDDTSTQPNKVVSINEEQQFKTIKIKNQINVSSSFSMIKSILISFFFMIIFNLLFFSAVDYKSCSTSSRDNCLLSISVFDFLRKVYFIIFVGVVLGMYFYIIFKYNLKKSFFFLLANLLFLSIILSGYTIQHHGSYVRDWVLIISFFTFLFLLTIHFLIKIYRNYNKILVSLLYLCLSILLSLSVYFYIFKYSCRDWKKGLKNEEISNDDPTCVTPKPKYCSYVILDGIFDLPYWFDQKCESEEHFISNIFLNSSPLKNFLNKTDSKLFTSIVKSTNEEYISNELSKHIKKIAFPRSETFNRTRDTLYGKAQSFVLNRIHIVNKNFNMTKYKPEYFIEYDEKDRKYKAKVELFYDNDLAKSSKKRFNDVYSNNKAKYEKLLSNKTNKTDFENEKRKLKPLFKNVLVYFSDATSRRHFYRKYPKLINFLERHYKNDTSKLSSYQFLKHQALYTGTLANIGAGYFGTFNKKNGECISTKFKFHGFVIGASQNMCTAELIDIKKKDDINYKFQKQDHEFWSPFCDPNVTPTAGFYKDFKGPYSVLKKCMWGKQTIDHSIEYTRQFFEKYKDNNKFFRLGTSDSHETSAEVIRYVDESISKFFEELEKNGTLDDTLLIIFSDHGSYSNGWYPRYFELDDYDLEVKLPGMFVVLPKNIENFDLIDKNMRSRQNTMTSSFDIYKTLLSVLDGSEEKKTFKNYGSGLFYSNSTVSKKDSCKFYGTRDDICMCLPLANVTLY